MDRGRRLHDVSRARCAAETRAVRRRSLQLGICVSAEWCDVPFRVRGGDLLQAAKAVAVLLDEDEALERRIDVEGAQHRSGKIDRLLPQGLALRTGHRLFDRYGGTRCPRMHLCTRVRKAAACRLSFTRVEPEIVVDSVELDLCPRTPEPMPLVRRSRPGHVFVTVPLWGHSIWHRSQIRNKMYAFRSVLIART